MPEAVNTENPDGTLDPGGGKRLGSRTHELGRRFGVDSSHFPDALAERGLYVSAGANVLTTLYIPDSNLPIEGALRKHAGQDPLALFGIQQGFAIS